MRITHVLIALLLTVPALTLAQPLNNTGPCKQSPSAQKYWARQYASLVAHGTLALKSGDQRDARESLDSAKKAAQVGCVKEQNALSKLEQGVAQVAIAEYMSQAARFIVEGEPGEARETLESIAFYSERHGLAKPEGHLILARAANEGVVGAFFNRIDKAVADKKLTPEQGATSIKNACVGTIIPTYNIGVPERCRPYAK